MRRRVAVGVWVVILLGVLVPALGSGATRPFEGEGEVVAVDLEKSSVTIKHGEIRGLMSPMTMEFTAKSRELLKGVRPGDKVRFTLERSGLSVILTEILRQGETDSK
ncbi:MAG: copper-binding protein [Deltaproteobacteria bacterium]|nr:copper-binding protein [Deltaproteobacteria bacterium]MBI3078273.1 copper-binding protein [Deltaproteobacteria bacterium]